MCSLADYARQPRRFPHFYTKAVLKGWDRERIYRAWDWLMEREAKA